VYDEFVTSWQRLPTGAFKLASDLVLINETTNQPTLVITVTPDGGFNAQDLLEP